MVKLIKEEFIPVSLDGATEGHRRDKVGEFIRESRCIVTGSTGAMHVVTAAGKLIGVEGTPSKGTPIAGMLNRALAAWTRLPASERKPGAVKIGQRGTIDADRAPPEPPPNCLIVRVWNRQLGYNGKGQLRYAIPSDFIKSARFDAARFKEPGNDFMWIPEGEWRALVPADPKVGDSAPLPQGLALRIMQYHLDPARGFGLALTFRGAGSKDGRLTATVEEVTPKKVTLRIEGAVNLYASGREEPSIYRPALLGYVEYNRQRKAVARFDMLALGTASGTPYDASETVWPRRGSYPLGIAFELVADPAPGERLRPLGSWWAGDQSAKKLRAIYLSPKDTVID